MLIFISSKYNKLIFHTSHISYSLWLILNIYSIHFEFIVFKVYYLYTMIA